MNPSSLALEIAGSISSRSSCPNISSPDFFLGNVTPCAISLVDVS